MKTMTINRPISTFAKELTDYQHRFYKETSEDKSIGGLIKYHVVGTILTSSITLILHAEAVRRAVIICFLSIQTAFSQSETELLETQQKEWTFAYSQSLRSFCALFNGKMLISRSDRPEASSPERLTAIHQEEETALHKWVEIRNPAAALPEQEFFGEVRENGREEAADQRLPRLHFAQQAAAPAEQNQQEENNLLINGPDSGRRENGELHGIGYHSDFSSEGEFAAQGALSPHRSEDGVLVSHPGSARGSHNGSDSSGPAFAPPGILPAPAPYDARDGVLVSAPSSARKSDSGSDSSGPAFAPPGILPTPAPYDARDGVLVSAPNSSRKSNSGSDASIPAFAPPGLLPAPAPHLLEDGVLVNVLDSTRGSISESDSSNGAFTPLDIVRAGSGNSLGSLSLSSPNSRRSSDGFEHVEYPLDPSDQSIQTEDAYTGLLQLDLSNPVLPDQEPPRESLIMIPEPHPILKILTPDEESALKNKMESEYRQQGAVQQVNVLPFEEVVVALREEIIHATAQVRSGDREIPHLRAPTDFQDPDWELSNGYIARHQVGRCNFATGQHVLGAQHLALLLPLEIGSTDVLIPAFGLFDPQIGPKAAQFLVKSLPGVLQTELSHFNKDGLTQDGIWNALTQTFLTLNSDFIRTNKKAKVREDLPEVIADHGASVALVLILGGGIWVSHLGNTKVALDNGGAAVQLTTNPDPRLPKYRSLVESLGGTVDSQGLVNGKHSAATGFGRYDLRGAISSKPVITQFPMARLKEGSHLLIETVGVAQATSTARQIEWIHADREADARGIAQNVAHSIHAANQLSPDPQVKNRPLSTMVIKLNAIEDEET
jgi:hypothetical protein